MKKINISGYLPLDEDAHVRWIWTGPLSFWSVRRSIVRYLNRCPHLGIELNWMPDQFLESGGDLIICSTHGALFKIDDGLCISGPCQGQALTSLQIVQDTDSTFIVLPG